jgi:hypothetical protein
MKAMPRPRAKGPITGQRPTSALAKKRVSKAGGSSADSTTTSSQEMWLATMS